MKCDVMMPVHDSNFLATFIIARFFYCNTPPPVCTNRRARTIHMPWALTGELPAGVVLHALARIVYVLRMQIGEGKLHPRLAQDVLEMENLQGNATEDD